MFVVLLTYVKPVEEVERYLQEHKDYLDPYYEQNKFVCSGPRNPRTGGVILMNVDSRAEVEEIIEADPFHQHNIANYEIVEFLPTKLDRRFSCFIDQLQH